MGLIAISHALGLGTEVYASFFKNQIELSGLSVTINPDTHKVKSLDFCLHLESLNINLLKKSRINALLPYPEHFFSTENLDKANYILCASKFCRDLFLDLKSKFNFNYDVVYISSTSLIPKKVDIKNLNYKKFLHLSGTSPLKNTRTVLETWLSEPNFPELNLVCLDRREYRSCFRECGHLIAKAQKSRNIKIFCHKLSELDKFNLQSNCGFAICPSEAESFGHYINESKGFGSIVISTNYPPMNELICTDFGFLLNSTSKTQRGFFSIPLQTFKHEELKRLVNLSINLPLEKKLQMSQIARDSFIQNDFFFKKEFNNFLQLIFNES
jgi:glycosyltransferase involved in cell wall biosynthesis